MTPVRASKPLAGMRVLIPRGGSYGEDVAAAVRGFGGIAVVAPMVNFSLPEDAAPLSSALRALSAGEYDWFVVSSAATVDVLVSQDIRIPDRTRVVCVGETTSTALGLAGYRIDFAPELDNSLRGLLREWPAEAGGRVLAPQPELSEPNLLEGLTELGAEVDVVTAYRTIGVPVSEKVAADVASGRINAVLISSGSVARQVAEQLSPLPASTIVACIGPRTAFDARAAGLTVDVIAETRSVESLIEGLAEFVKSRQ